MDAATKVMGRPSNALGVSAPSIRERTPENRTIARKNPSPEPKEFTIEDIKSYFVEMLRIVTPKTAQFVVMSGR